MSSVYVSGHDKKQAREFAARARSAGLKVVSTWHETPDDVHSTVLFDDQKAKKVAENIEQINRATYFVMFAADDKVPGGKFVELGYALGQCGCYIIGRRENLYCYDQTIVVVPDEAACLKAIYLREEYGC
jgi:hypothetical protein